jgi:drug/metabolite transporter (DMT)-like permease
MTPVVLALASASAFGAMSVAIRLALRDGGETVRATLALLCVSLAVAVVASLPRHDYSDAWRFFLAGVLAPGLSQLLFTLSIREVGASRTSVTVGTAPLFALTIAFVLLGEPVKASLILGAVAIVTGGVFLAIERDRPKHFRARGLVYALVAAALFATRDNVVRALHAHGNPEAVAATTMLAGALVALCATRSLPTSRELRRFAPSGLLFGASYVCLFEAYFRGRVSVVSPLVATESLWAVGLAALVFGRSEGLGRRLLLGATAIVAGGILIGFTAS